MVVSEVIAHLLDNPDFKRGLAICQLVGVNVPFRVANGSDVASLQPYVQQCLTFPSAYTLEYEWKPDRQKRTPKKKVQQPEIRVIEPDEPEQAEEEPEEMQWEFPANYPPVLQEKLIQANKLVKEKRKLSNSLAPKYPEPQPDTVKAILSLQQQIDNIYDAKRHFDKTGILPDKWLVDVDEKTSNEIERLTKRRNTLRTYVSKKKAKLNNPFEIRTLDVHEVQLAIEDHQQEISLINQKIYQLKVHGQRAKEMA